MSNRSYIQFLNDILGSCKKIIKHTAGMECREFLKNEILIDAMVRNIEIIGEAVKHIPEDIQAGQYSET